VLLALVLTGGFLVHSTSLPSTQVFATGTGEVRPLTLDDGSRVDLDTQTKLEWSSDEKGRRAVLHDGEAFFEVRADAQRPFRVEVGDSAISALGTGFNVYRKAGGRVVVTVLNGAVLVEGYTPGRAAWHRELYANQHIEYGSDGLIRDTCTSTTASNATSWREGRLQFEDAPLSQVVEELQRYTDRHIIIGDPRFNQMRFGGALSSRDIGAALARLAKVTRMTVTEHGDAFTLNYRP